MAQLAPATDDAAELAALETTIERGLETFVDVGNALLVIRDRKLWRFADHDSFDKYCNARWHFQRRRADYLIDAAKVFANLTSENGTIVPNCIPESKTILPENEGQTRPLAQLPPEKQKEAWAEAVKTAPKDDKGKPKVTAKDVRKAVDKVTVKKVDPPKEESAPPAKPEPVAAPVVVTPPAPSQPDDIPPWPPAMKPVTVDGVGRKIPKNLLNAFAEKPLLTSLQHHVSTFKRRFEECSKLDVGAYLEPQRQQFTADVNNLRGQIRFGVPYAVCPYCGGTKCSACKQSGWMPKEKYQNVPSDVRGTDEGSV